MAQLKDTIVSGNLRVTDTAIANTVQVTTIKAPTSSGGTSYGPGSDGQVLKSNGTSVYWTSDNNSVTGVKGNAETNYRTGNVNITPANIGALALSGGTMTGVLTVKASQYTDEYGGALNMNNSNIYGLNAIYTADPAGNASEGIHFYRDETHVDTLWVSDGSLLFVPNREMGTTTTAASSQKVGRFTATPTTAQVVITDGTEGGIKSSGYTIATSVPSNAVFTDRYVNTAAFADDTTSNASNPIKMTLTRAGSDTTTVTGNIPKVSSSSAGVAPKGAAVSSQSQTTKFLREDGSWAAPSYTSIPSGNVTGTSLTADQIILGNGNSTIKASGKTIATSVTDVDTTVPTSKAVKTFVEGKGYTTNTGTVTSVATGVGLTGGSITTSGTLKAKLQSETKFGADATTVSSPGSITTKIYPVLTDKTDGYLAVNVPWTDTDTKVTSSDNHYSPSTVSGQDKSASASGATAAWSIDVVKGVTLNTDGKGHVTGISVTSGKIPANPNRVADGTVNQMAYYSAASTISSSPAIYYKTANSTATTPAERKILGIYGATYGNTAENMISGTAGLFSYGDGGPQIDFNSSASGPQAGALIYTDNDTAAAGASWHFVSNQTDWNVTSKRFHARTSVSIGTNLPVTSHNLYVKGTTSITGATRLGGRLSTTKPINDVITGSGTTAQDKGSGVSPRYFPAKWTFNTGHTATNGDIVVVKLPCAGHDYGVFVSINNGTNYYPVSVSGTARLTTHYGNGQFVALMFKSDGGTNQVYALNGGDARVNITGGAWIVLNFYDSGDTYDKNRYNAAIKAWGTKIIAGNIIVGINGLYHHLKEGTAFDITYPILYLNADCNASSTTSNTYDQINFTITTTQSITLTAYKPVYIKGTLSGTTFTPVSTAPLTQTVPSTDDGFVYMLLGNATSTTAVFLLDDHRIFAYKNSTFGELSVSKLSGTVGNSGLPVYLNNGMITACSVPVSGAWWNTSNIFVPQISTSGVVEIGRYIDFHATAASANTYDIRLDASDTGTMYLYSNAAGPNFRIRGTQPSLNFVQETSGAAYNATTCGIVAYPGDTYGVNMVMQSGGNVFVGGGESPTKVYDCVIAAETNPYASSSWINSEKLFLTTDEDLYISTNAGSVSSEAHTDWTDLNSWVFTSSGYFHPTVNDKSSLGTSSYYWHSSYITNMHANYAELKRDTYPILVLNRDGSTAGAFIQFKNSNGVLGYIGMTGAADGGLVRMNSARTSAPIIHDQDNTSGIGHFCTCDTATNTLAKVATTVSTDTTFKLVTGVSVTVKFTNSHTASGTATLNVNGTGAKNISHICDSNTSRYFWNANAVVDFVYDGTQWIIQHGGTATTTYWGLTKLNSTLTSSSVSYAATASTVKTLNETKLNNNTQTVLYDSTGTTITNALTSIITLSTTTFGVYKLLIVKYSSVDVDVNTDIDEVYDFIVPCDYVKSLGTSNIYETSTERGFSGTTNGMFLQVQYKTDSSLALCLRITASNPVTSVSNATIKILGVV